MIKQYEDGYRSWPSNAAIFLPGGQVPKVGDRFLQTDLADTLQYMVDQERAASKRGRLAGLAAARAAFYCGDIAETIVRYHERTAAISPETTSPTSTAATRSRSRSAGGTSTSIPAGRGARGRCWHRRCA